MITSIDGSRDGRKGLELEKMEHEFEAGFEYNGDDDHSHVVDPDISLSYIEEKLHNVLGHFQKDFEGGVVSAENLGAKFGGYGSFLPTYQRSPSSSHARSQKEVLYGYLPSSPRKLHLEDHRPSSLASTSASPSYRPSNASGRTSSRGDSGKEPSSNCGVLMKSVKPPDQRTLKVRLRVGSENLTTKKNAEIYSGLGLVSPSSSLDDSPETTEGLCAKLLESPSSILEIMTSVHRDLLLSPLPEDLIYQTEKRKPRVKSESETENKKSIEGLSMLSNGINAIKNNQKVLEHKTSKSSDKYDAFPNKASERKKYGYQNDTGSLLKKEKEPDADALGYEEHLSNALKLPLLRSSQNNANERISIPATVPVIALKDEVKEETFSKFTEEEYMHGGSIQNIYKERKAVADEPIKPLKQEVVEKGGPDSVEGLNPAPENSSTGGKRKPKRVENKTAQFSNVRENQLIADSSVTSQRKRGSLGTSILPKNEKPGDRYKDFFGDVEFEEDNIESISASQQAGKMAMNENISSSNEKRDVKSSKKPRQPDNYTRLTTEVGPSVGNGPSSEHPVAVDPLVNEQWVLCEKCGKWRLLPLETNPSTLPEKWLCKMLTWLPGMNRCSVPEAVTTSTLRALYQPAPLVPANASENQHDWIKSSVPTTIEVAPLEARHAQENQNVAGQTAKVNSKKKKHRSTSATYSTDIDGSTHSFNSGKTNLPSSGKNSNNSNRNACQHQQIQQKNHDIDKPNDVKRDGIVSLVNSSDPGSNIKTKSKRKSDADGSRDSKRIKGEKLHDDDLIRSRKSDDKKRKQKEYHASEEAMRENGHQKEKKVRVSKSMGKEVSGTKCQIETERKSDIGSLHHSLAANSSSSKVSGSHKNKLEEVKASPVESVSSSPLRRNPDRVTLTSTGKNDAEKDDAHDSGSIMVVNARKLSGCEVEGNNRIGNIKKESVLPANDHYHSKKSGNLHSKEMDHTSGSDMNTDKTKASDLSRSSLDQTPISQEKLNNRRTKLDEKSGTPTPTKVERVIAKKDAAKGKPVENSKEHIQKESGSYHDQDKTRNLDRKHNLDKEPNFEKLPRKYNQAEVEVNKKTHSLPPLARSQGESVSLDNGDALKVSNQSKKAENQISSRQPTPTSSKGQDIGAPSPLRRDTSSYAANNAIKEATNLKHLADRLKKNGSIESIGYYFQAVLKFLHGASLLESGSNETTKQNDVARAIQIYSTTAKLCEYCAHEFEKSKDVAAAALAYKCTEAAYMRVVYSSHTSAIRDRNELQTALQVAPPGESPSSSASDIDNLNHQAITDKAPLAKVLGSPQVSGSHVISSRNRAGFSRLLNFAQEVNFAMEASRKSRISFTAATSKLGETSHREGITSLKRALDFSFQDIEGLLRLVRVAMEAIGR